MKNLTKKLTDDNLCIGKFDEADVECRHCSGYEYRRECYFAVGKTNTEIEKITEQDKRNLSFLARVWRYLKR